MDDCCGAVGDCVSVVFVSVVFGDEIDIVICCCVKIDFWIDDTKWEMTGHGGEIDSDGDDGTCDGVCVGTISCCVGDCGGVGLSNLVAKVVMSDIGDWREWDEWDGVGETCLGTAFIFVGVQD